MSKIQAPKIGIMIAVGKKSPKCEKPAPEKKESTKKEKPMPKKVPEKKK